jgi:hypothetical protein
MSTNNQVGGGSDSTEVGNADGGVSSVVNVEEEKKPSVPVVNYPTIPTSTTNTTTNPISTTTNNNNKPVAQAPVAINDSYEVKRLEFMGKKVPILLQSKNGPCPLLAIANQLLLSNLISFPEHTEDVTLDNLVHIIAERM